MNTLLTYKKHLEKLLASKNVDEWTNKDYVNLSERIFEKTTINISSNTLKRIFGKLNYKDGNFTPQKASLDALAQFIDYPNWHEFETTVKQDRSKKQHTIILSLISIAILLSIAILIFNSSGNHVDLKIIKENEHTPLKIRAIYSNLNTFHNYTIQCSNSSWKVELLPEKNEIDYVYRNAGYYNIKLFKNNKIIQQIPILIPTKKYETRVSSKAGNLIFQENELHYNNYFHVPDSVLTENIKTYHEYWTEFHFYDSICPGDNFIYHARIKNPLQAKNIGQDIATSIIGENESIIIPIADSLGEPNISLIITNKTIIGRYDDLSAFIHDADQFFNLRIEVRNNNVKVYFNDTLIYGSVIKKPLGHVIGLKTTMLGSGFIDYIQVTDTNNVILYSEKFD